MWKARSVSYAIPVAQNETFRLRGRLRGRLPASLVYVLVVSPWPAVPSTLMPLPSRSTSAGCAYRKSPLACAYRKLHSAKLATVSIRQRHGIAAVGRFSGSGRTPCGLFGITSCWAVEQTSDQRPTFAIRKRQIRSAHRGRVRSPSSPSICHHSLQPLLSPRACPHRKLRSSPPLVP